jgi:hypothetical protein
MAGEIQLNSTTMATESSGSITAEMDTIRPNTTNGSLTLQGDSSDAGVTGLTIDSSGNATFAQTISGGTIGSSVVFPAGHILQVVHTETTETNPLDSTYTNYYEVPLTLKSNSSDVIVTFTFNYAMGNIMGFGVKIYRSNSAGVTTSDNEVWTKNPSNSTGPYSIYYNGITSVYGVSSITGKDTLTGLNAGDTIYYGLFARMYQTDDVIEFPINATEDGFFSSLIMEVQK